jgi:hypothetical protein
VVTISKGRLSVLFVAAVAVAAGVCFFLGTQFGANMAVTELRSVAFGSRDMNLRRLLELDRLLAAGELDLARRKVAAVAWAEYSSLEDDVSGVVLPPTDPMRSSLPAVRTAVEEYCQSDASAFHSGSNSDICGEAVRRSNKSFERTREG